MPSPVCLQARICLPNQATLLLRSGRMETMCWRFKVMPACLFSPLVFFFLPLGSPACTGWCVYVGFVCLHLVYLLVFSWLAWAGIMCVVIGLGRTPLLGIFQVAAGDLIMLPGLFPFVVFYAFVPLLLFPDVVSPTSLSRSFLLK